jgi:hypothetical protein
VNDSLNADDGAFANGTILKIEFLPTFL